MMRTAQLDTPALIVDLDRLEANIQAQQDALNAAGVKFRPHVKTHKVPGIAHMQLAAGACGITVAKVAEAEVFAGAGCRDIFIAYPVIGPEKWSRAGKLARRCTLTVGVDSLEGAEGLAAAARAAGAVIRVRVEVDLGLNRSGVPPDQVGDLCRAVTALPGLDLDGIFTFRGAAFPAAGSRTPYELGLDEGAQMALLAQRLRAGGMPIREVSVGSTPTGLGAARVPGVTEVRAGTYVFGDWMLAALGAHGYDQIALSVLCTVVSLPAPGKATVDGGSKTFAGDVFPPRVNLPGYAVATGLDAYVETLSEEHGVVRLGEGVRPRIGNTMAFYPIHVCTVVNLADSLVGVRNGRVERIWPVLARGQRT